MLSMTPANSCGGICWRISFSTRSHKAAVSSMRVPVGARRCSVNSPLSTDGKKSCPSHGSRAKERKQARRKPAAKTRRRPINVSSSLRHKEITGHAGEHEHGYKHDANAEG